MAFDSSTTISRRLADNLAAVRLRVAAACGRAGRDPESVRIVAVTKYASPEMVDSLAALGQLDFGENRPQQLIERAARVREQFAAAETGGLRPPLALRWHLIGQLQRNKVRSVLPHVALVHSVDSLRLLDRIGSVAAALQMTADVLLQVNISGEPTKSGFSADELRQAWVEQVPRTGNVRIQGLMTMAPETEDESVIRHSFRGLRQLRDELRSQSPDIPLAELSMGMSGDFEIAVEEGATIVRLGSVLFEGCEQFSG